MAPIMQAPKQETQEPTVVQDETPDVKEPVLTEGEQQRQDFVQQMLAMRDVKVPEYVPPPPTERQRTQIELEMEAGRRRVAQNVAHDAARPRPVKDPTEGHTTPVFRPKDHVPSMESKGPKATVLSE